MSSTTTPTGGASSPTEDRKAVEQTVSREAGSARAEAGKAAETVKDEAAGLAATAKQKAIEGVEQGKSVAASSLSDFTAAIRKASDELGERDQSLAAGLARQAASGLEQAADAISGQSVQDLTRSVADFARRQPTAFLLGAALAGVALGRFARASSDHADPFRSGDRYRDEDWRRENVGGGAPRSNADRPVGASDRGYTSYGGFEGRSGASSTGSSSPSGSSLNRAGASGSTDTSGLSRSNPAAGSSQGDALGGQRTTTGSASPIDSALNKPGASGSSTPSTSGSSTSGERP
ncbi:hypothetical protein [Aureimonas sp. ME7]|uniref:hypothetical protein n=1 Tax=Aureimonas sp. ME7 TaxID=2744252 RepID=UPI0015F50294|nr:hypothetical protein [Aureimonas sp. ME7]